MGPPVYSQPASRHAAPTSRSLGSAATLSTRPATAATANAATAANLTRSGFTIPDEAARTGPTRALSAPRTWRGGPPTTTPACGSELSRWRSWSLGKLREVGLSLLHVSVATFLRLFAHVVEEGRVAGELLDARKAIVHGIEARLQHAQRKRAELEHLPAPRDRFHLQVRKRNDLVDQSHVERLLRVVLLAQKPDLACFLLAHDTCEQAGPIAAVEAPDPRSSLAEAGVVRGDRQVADDMQNMTSPDLSSFHS